MKKNLIFLLFLVTPFATLYSQQDAQFTQYMFNGIYINPAYAGYREQWNLHFFYRNQWSGFPGAPKTMSFAVDGVTNDNRSGLALQVVSDKIGLQNNTSLYVNYALRIPLEYEGSGKTLALGIGAGFIQDRLDISAFDPETGVGLDPALYNAKPTKILPDASIGIFYNTNSFYAGLSANNLITQFYYDATTPDKALIQRRIHLYATAGGLIPLSDQLMLKPSVLLKEDFAGPTSLDLNAFLLIDETVWVGAGYRATVFQKSTIQDDLKRAGAITGLVEVYLGQKFRIGYAYDYSINTTAMQSYPTHEISLGYFFTNPRAAMLSPRYF